MIKKQIRFKYKKGYRFERRVMELLKKAGCYSIRAGKSSFPDICAITGTGEPVFIECKNRAKIPFDPIKLLSKEEYRNALELVKANNTPFILAFNKKGKIIGVCVVGKGIHLLYKLGFR